MKFLFFVLGLTLVASVSEAAKAKKVEKKKSPHEMTETELRAAAESELRAGTAPAGKIIPLESPATGMVSTSEILKEEVKEPFDPAEFELGVQSYSPTGSGRISNVESYSYGKLSAKPMLKLGFRRWMVQRLRTSTPWRAGLGLSGGFGTHSLDIRTNRGVNYSDVRLNTFMAFAGPEAEYFLDGRRRFALGLGLAYGKIFASQTGDSSSLNRSQDASAWEGGGHFRYQPSPSFFARLAYARRSILKSEGGLGTQQNNYGAFIGFGM